MAEIKDGGPAFPTTPANGYGGFSQGVSKREFFAAHALIGIAGLLTTQEIDDLANGIKGGAIQARAAAQIADAMIEALGIGEQP